jgi:hypothetical protein
MSETIEPMSVAEFFKLIRPLARVHLTIYQIDEDNGGGYRADAASKVSYGDTPEEAIRAAYDHFCEYKSKRSRMNPPFFSSDCEARRWDKAHRVKYDYRAVDWEPPK